MRRNKLGNTGLEVSRLGLGGIPFQYISQTESSRIIQSAHDRGVNVFYTSRMYRDSENKIGVATRGFRDQVVLGTSTHKRKKTDGRQDIEQSLRNFGVDYIDVYSLHNVLTLGVLKEIMSPGGAYQALEEMRNAGFVKHVGISAHQPETILRALEMAAFDVVEFPLNIADREAAGGLIEQVRSRGIGFVSIKPMMFGYAADAAIAFKYVFSAMPDSTIVGTYKIEELEENLAAEEAAGEGETVSSDEMMDAIAASERKCYKVFCRRCEECVVCPQGIDIKKILRLYEYFDRYHSWDWAREEYAAMRPGLEVCDDCGVCERECPHHIPVKREIRKARIDLLPRRSPTRLIKKKIFGK